MQLQAASGPERYRYFPTGPQVQASGSAYCSKNDQIGTLGVRVTTAADDQYAFVATYHNFAEYMPPQSAPYQWLYAFDATIVKFGPTGRALQRQFRLGPDPHYSLMDSALIALDGSAPNVIAPGVYQGSGRQVVHLHGTGWARPGTIVTKYGLTTGFTYGMVIPLPPSLAAYEDFAFLIQLCDSQGYPMSGAFADGGDSGAPILDLNGYVLGMLIQVTNNPNNADKLGFATRIDQIENALQVTVRPD